MLMKKDILIGISLAVLLFICVIVIMLDVNKTFDIITSRYEQKHKVFVPDTIPGKLDPDSIKTIKTIKDEYFQY